MMPDDKHSLLFSIRSNLSRIFQSFNSFIITTIIVFVKSPVSGRSKVVLFYFSSLLLIIFKLNAVHLLSVGLFLSLYYTIYVIINWTRGLFLWYHFFSLSHHALSLFLIEHHLLSSRSQMNILL